MANQALPPLRYLSAADVRAAMPALPERLGLAERTMTALASPGMADLPPKIGVHPRPDGSFGHAMPAHLRAAGEDGSGDLAGMKWVMGFPSNSAADLPQIHAIVVVNDATTGIPKAILDGGPITAERTAAVSGVAIRHFSPRIGGRPARAGLIGAGVQGRSHVPVLGYLLPGVELTVYDRDPERARLLAALAAETDGIGAVFTAADPRAATEEADVVVTVASFGPVRQVMTDEWLQPWALVVPVDYATYCSAATARNADLFLVDERAQFLFNRDLGLFEDYPDPDTTLGEAILARTARPAGRVVATHLGVGLADVIFAEAILRSAETLGLGTILPR
jgi:ornithine cyclodeaminase/alanine dehydrogenase-like protein (mu-crystallin family)